MRRVAGRSRERYPRESLFCAVCVYVNTTPNPAATIIAGTAACADHLGYLHQDAHLSAAVRQARREQGE